MNTPDANTPLHIRPMVLAIIKAEHCRVHPREVTL